MKAYWEKFSARVDAMARRERALVLVAVVVCLIAVLNALLLDPLAARTKRLRQQIDSDNQQIVALRAQIQSMIQAGSIDPDAANKAQLGDLQTRLQQVDAELSSMQQGLIRPEDMPRMLESLLRKDPRLKMLALKTLPVSPLTVATPPAGPAPAAAPAAAPTPAADTLPVYRHGVQVVVQGRYLDLLDYLTMLEQMPWRVIWGSMHFEAGEFPSSTMTVTVYTLGLDEEWLSI